MYSFLSGFWRTHVFILISLCSPARTGDRHIYIIRHDIRGSSARRLRVPSDGGDVRVRYAYVTLPYAATPMDEATAHGHCD